MAKRKRGRQSAVTGALAIVRSARNAAKRALDSLREEIHTRQEQLQKLLSEERSFREELFGAARSAGGARTATRRSGGPKAMRRTGAAKPATRAPRRKGPPQAERFFAKLPDRFTLEEVRKLAGAKAGISLAQWSRARRIKKVGTGYQKVK